LSINERRECRERNEQMEKEGELPLSAMLGQRELAFIKAITDLELSPLFLEELRKAMAEAKRSRALAATTSTCVDETGALPDQNACKRKAAPDCATEAAYRHPAPKHPPIEGPEFPGAIGEQVAQSSRQLRSAEGRVAYATVVAGGATMQQPSGLHMSEANGSATAEPAASPEAAIRRMSPADVYGPLCCMPDGATTYAQLATGSAASFGERPNKTPIFISGYRDTRSFLAWLWSSYPGGHTAKLKSDKLMVVRQLMASEPSSAHCGPSI
jgi:hypothetical protein